MDKILALINLFRKGQAVDNPTAWKNHQVTATMVGVVIMALVQLAKAFGYELPIDDTTATAIAGGIIATVNIVLTYITSDKLGVLQPIAEQPVSTVDTPIKSDVPENKPLHTPSTLPLVSQTYIEEAKAAIRDRANGNVYAGS